MGQNMWRLIKVMLVLLLLAVILFVAYAYVGPILFHEDFSPTIQEVVKPATLGVE